MAATNGSGNTRKNYYSVSYGKLSTRVKEVPENSEEIKESELKSLTQDVENIDLRNRHVVKTGDYPYVAFYDKIEGYIRSIDLNDSQHGKSLNIEILDTDDEVSIIQIRMYSKYTENLLNRLCNLKDFNKLVTFTPYAIPSSFEGENGAEIKLYNQGVSIRVEGEKLDITFASDNKDLPKLERITDSNGKETTSRVKRINFLFDTVSDLFNKFLSDTVGTEKNAVEKSKDASTEDNAPVVNTNDSDVDEDDLPF